MKKICVAQLSIMILLLLFSTPNFAQSNSSSPMDALSYGVVLDDPGMKNVKVQKDIPYLQDAKGVLALDIYMPRHLKEDDKLPAVIFLNAIGETPGQRKVKSWGIYTSWPQLVAAQGYIGISMESDGSRIQESLQALFAFLDAKGNTYHVDKNRLGVYAASANVTQSVIYLMDDKAYPGIKAAVLYYGGSPTGPFRKDLPVFFVVSEGDMRPEYNALWSQVLKNNAPWTIRMATGMPHAFDAFSDNDDARKIVKETISFWKSNLDPVPAPSWGYSKGRDVLGSLQMNRPKALTLLESLSKEHPNDVQVLSFYANTLRQAQQYDKAGAVYKEVLRIEPANINALMAVAALFYAQDKKAEADSYISQAEQTGNVKRNDYAQLAYSLLVANKNKEAAYYYEKALAIEPRNFDYYNLACAYAKMNDKENALKALDNSLKYGYGSKQQFENDPDLNSLKSDERFKAILQKMN